jgi:hypothetical protein
MGIAEIGDRGKEEEPGRGTGRRRWPVGAVAIGTGGRACAREGWLGYGLWFLADWPHHVGLGPERLNPSRRGRGRLEVGPTGQSL